MRYIREVWLGLAISLAVLSACNDKAAVETEGDQAAEPSAEMNTAPQSNQGFATVSETPQAETVVSLNNGEKWVADTETTSRINDMLNMINELPAKDSERDYKLIQNNVRERLVQIISYTKMTGDGYEELKNYIRLSKVYLMDINSPDESKRRQAVESLKNHLQSYSYYFS